MEKIILLSLLMLFAYLLFTPPLNAQNDSVVEWLSDKEYDFGDLEKDKPSETVFKFKNITVEPITIENVRTTCGCTAPDWSYEPILPGEVGEIKIEYDAHKPRYFRKRILVFFTEQKKSERLYVSGYVEEI